VLARIALAAALLGLTITSAGAQIRIGLMVSATGPTSAIGIRQKNTGDILPRTIGGARVEYISLEDGGDTTRAVQNVKKLIAENNIDALEQEHEVVGCQGVFNMSPTNHNNGMDERARVLITIRDGKFRLLPE
jgi:hypothetical protein